MSPWRREIPGRCASGRLLPKDQAAEASCRANMDRFCQGTELVTLFGWVYALCATIRDHSEWIGKFSDSIRLWYDQNCGILGFSSAHLARNMRSPLELHSNFCAFVFYDLIQTIACKAVWSREFDLKLAYHC